MALFTVSISGTPTFPGGSVGVTADTFTELKTKVQTELQNRLNAQNANAGVLQNAINALNS